MTEQIPQTNPNQSSTVTEERQWAMIAHLSVLINLFAVFMGIVVPIIIYFLYREKSRFIAYHALQAIIIQGICSFTGMLFAVISGAIASMVPLIGLLCVPFACIFGLLPLIALIYGTYGGIQVNQGQDFKYWQIGDWVRSTLTG